VKHNEDNTQYYNKKDAGISKNKRYMLHVTVFVYL